MCLIKTFPSCVEHFALQFAKVHTHVRSEQVARDERVRDEPSGPSKVKYPTEEVQLIDRAWKQRFCSRVCLFFKWQLLLVNISIQTYLDRWVNKPLITIAARRCHLTDRFTLRAIQGYAYHWIDLTTLGWFHVHEQSHSGPWPPAATSARAHVPVLGSKMSMCLKCTQIYMFSAKRHVLIWSVTTFMFHLFI